MSNTVLKSFDPFATHPFTNAQGVVPQPPHPQSYATAGAPQSSSLPTQHTPPPLSPQPRSPSQAQAATSKAIFTPFQRDRASPDLPVDALMKKSTSTQWGRTR